MSGEADNVSSSSSNIDSRKIKKNVSKMAFRSKEMMLRTLGRGDETKDEIIDNYVHLLNKQQTQAQKFQRELKNYINSLNAMKTASSSFYQTINSIYEEDWNGKPVISSLNNRSEQLYEDLKFKLNEAINPPLNRHSNMCNDIRFKVNKRGRKMVDFDAARRTLTAAKSMKKPDENKMTKAREQVEVTGAKYEQLNSELHTELPDLYDSRLPLYCNIITGISIAENAFNGEMSEIRGRLLATVETLKDEFENGKYHIQRMHSPVFSTMKEKIERKNTEDATLPSNEKLQNNKVNGDTKPHVSVEKVASTSDDDVSKDIANDHVIEKSDENPPPNEIMKSSDNGIVITEEENAQEKPIEEIATEEIKNKEISVEETIEEIKDDLLPTTSDVISTEKPTEIVETETVIPNDKVTEENVDQINEVQNEVKLENNQPNLPEDYMFTVRAQHNYQGDDEDELSFSRGDLIYVLKYPDPEEQDEGWQLGVLKHLWENPSDETGDGRGLFPENFTKRTTD